ncbi:conserved hypothetical protein [uncultured Sporomusa sp.]|uniref:Peptidase M28 domain-containing protein n=1 Tax=uncultured Sporomusa sp. TaxID=307249 RepID=A0A212LZG9_9FIRM|nr:M28 family peptidase [uncultured Sporomusa sp.]SCM82923.1 conserved hypothetical protein [uncultured Sporomusa sp.]
MEDNSTYVNALANEIREKYPKRYSLHGHKEEFYQLIKKEVENLDLEIEVRPRDFIQNICTQNDDFDILLMAHYDTAPKLPLSRFINSIYEKVGVGNWRTYIGYFLYYVIIIGLNVSVLWLLNSWFSHVWFFIYIVGFIIFFFLRANPNNMNDNSSGVIAVLTIAKILCSSDKNIMKHIKIVLTDFEEWGKHGAKKLRRELLTKGLENRLIINFDGVGNGTFLNLVPISKDNLLRKYLLDNYPGKYRVIEEKVIAGSDYDVFKAYNAIGINFLEMAQIQGKYYMPNIHTSRDIEINEKQLAEFTNDVAQFLISYIKEIRKV